MSLNMYTYIFIASMLLRFLLCLLRKKSFPWEESASHPTSLLLVKSECRKLRVNPGKAEFSNFKCYSEAFGSDSRAFRSAATQAR